jgi:PBSX family phage terminase large subunit
MLVISRNDIDREDITEFSASERFIKLPIKNYLKLLGIWETVNRPQIALINAVNSPKYRFVCAALARRLGKTYIANVVAQLVTLIPGSNVLIMSPNYNLSSISFELQRKLIKHFDLEITRDNLKDKLIELSNGSTIRMGSVSTVDSCVGRSYDLIIFDEAALSTGGEDAFNVALRPTLDKPNAKAIFISTPRGKNNWFSKFYSRGFSDEFPEWCSLTADYSENERMKESDVAEARRSMSRAEFEQEYMASFASFEGQIYSYNAEDTKEYSYMEGDEVLAGIDPGYRDPTAFAVIAYRHETDSYYVIDEYLESEATTAKHAAVFAEKIGKWQIDSIFIDSAAPQFASDLAYLYDIPTIKAKKDVLPGIAYVQTIIEQRRLFVAPHCKHTLAMLDQYRWDTKENLQREKPLHDEYSHMADAVRYALYTFTV